MRTLLAVEGLWLRPDGTPATGWCSFTANSIAYNAGLEYRNGPLSGYLDELGRLCATSGYALELFATDDAGTTPTDLTYTVTERIDEQDLWEFTTALPAASTAMDAAASLVLGSPLCQLGNLIAAACMVGQPISGTGVPSLATVLGFDPIGNTLTMSAGASASETQTTITVGGAVLLSSLEPVSQ